MQLENLQEGDGQWDNYRGEEKHTGIITGVKKSIQEELVEMEEN